MRLNTVSRGHALCHCNAYCSISFCNWTLGLKFYCNVM